MIFLFFLCDVEIFLSLLSFCRLLRWSRRQDTRLARNISLLLVCLVFLPRATPSSFFHLDTVSAAFSVFLGQSYWNVKSHFVSVSCLLFISNLIINYRYEWILCYKIFSWTGNRSVLQCTSKYLISTCSLIFNHN